MRQPIQSLIDLGLGEKESRVYLELYKLGPSTAYVIAQRSGIKRPTVYLVLDELMKKSLVLKTPYPNKQIYTAKDLDDFLDQHTQANIQGKRLQKKLNEERSQFTSSVFHFEGVEGIRQALDYRMDDMQDGVSSSILGSLSNDDLLPVFRQWHTKIRQIRNYKWRILISKKDYIDQFRLLRDFVDEDGSFIEIKVLEQPDLPKDFSIETFQNKNGVQFMRVIADVEQHVTIIETRAVAEGFQRLFDALWVTAKKI